MRRLLLSLTAFLALAAALAAPPLQAAWLWPVRGEVITHYRNGSDPYAAGQHRGIDIAAAVGAPVVAAASGEVLFAGTAGSSGLTVSVRTGDGFDTSYLHLSAFAVRRGDRVSAGQRLGAVGTTGERSAEAPHLHFGVREAGTRHAYVDPLSLLPPALARPPSEAPHPAPAPAPAPLAPRPAPAPVPRGAPRPIPTPERAPRPLPAPGRAPRRLPTPGRAPRPAPTPGRGPRPAPAPGRVPRPVPAPHGAPLARRAPAPALAPGTAAEGAPGLAGAPALAGAARTGRMPALTPQHGSARGPLRASPHLPSSTSGPDLGWALACVGLLLAAGVLGLTDDGRNATARSRSRLAGALRPLLGRR